MSKEKVAAEWTKYLESFDAQKQEATLFVLNTAKKYIPDAEETMSYAMPTLKYKGKGILAVAPWKNHIGLYPFGTSNILKTLEALKLTEVDKGIIRFKYDKLPTDKQIQAIVEAKLSSLR